MIEHSINLRDVWEDNRLFGGVVTGIVAGLAGLVVSFGYGHPPAVSLVIYSLSGCFGLMTFALITAQTREG